jgi:hypothetical protein
MATAARAAMHNKTAVLLHYSNKLFVSNSCSAVQLRSGNMHALNKPWGLLSVTPAVSDPPTVAYCCCLSG